MPRDGTITKPDTEAAALLRKAQALINTPEKWCQGVGALDPFGRAVLPDSPTAISFCSAGALSVVDVMDLDTEAFTALRAAAEKMGFHATEDECPVVNLNDTTDHPTVMAMFDLAIRLAREEA